MCNQIRLLVLGLSASFPYLMALNSQGGLVLTPCSCANIATLTVIQMAMFNGFKIYYKHMYEGMKQDRNDTTR